MQNILDPAILFFVFGVIAGMVKSNLKIPPIISRFLSLYLLMALGLKGGFAIEQSGLTVEIVISLAATILMAISIPLLGYWILRRFVSKFDAAAVAATYGSVSAVTFVTAIQYLEQHNIPYGGHMAAAMALMESPAIIMAVAFSNNLRQQASLYIHSPEKSNIVSIDAQFNKTSTPIIKILHESFTDGAQLLLLGSMAIGLITGGAGKSAMQPFSVDLFKGMLSFFLLDMGLMTARNLPKLKSKSPVLVAYAILGPIAHAGIALCLAYFFNLSVGNGSLVMVLSASASYIAVPAVLRYALPEASPSLYLGLSLGVTFPLNILFGIPFYVYLAQKFLIFA
jgi:hypothetical protein